MPLVWFNRLNEIKMMDLTYVKTTTPTAVVGMPTDELRAAYHSGLAVGDSGSPACLVNDDRLVVSHSIANSQGVGVWLSGVLDWADELVARTGHSLDYLRP